MVMNAIRNSPECSNVDAVVVVGQPGQWDIAVVRSGPDAFGGWGKLREVIEHFRERHDLVPD
jgi:hypothetical protein